MTVEQFRDEKVRRREIGEEVLKTHRYHFDPEGALRGQCERWQKGRKPAWRSSLQTRRWL